MSVEGSVFRLHPILYVVWFMSSFVSLRVRTVWSDLEPGAWSPEPIWNHQR
jgi:hypothetical protein